MTEQDRIEREESEALRRANTGELTEMLEEVFEAGRREGLNVGYNLGRHEGYVLGTDTH